MTMITASVGRGGINREHDVRTVQELLNKNRNFPLKSIKVDGKIGSETITAIEDFQRQIVKFAHPDGRVDPDGKTLRALLSGNKNTLRWPLINNVIRGHSESNTFGMVRRRLVNGKWIPRNHQGWDFYAIPGTPCFAVSNGKVVYSGKDGDYGTLLVIEFQYSGQELYAAYAHLLQSLVKLNDSVTIGQKVALTGNSGNAKNMKGHEQHLHFEIRTTATPGGGLAGRKSPLEIYHRCPLIAPILDPI